MPPNTKLRRAVTIVGTSGAIVHDNLNDYPISISAVHHQIHEGATYQCVGISSLGNNGQKLFHIVTPDITTWVHLGLSGLITARGANSNVAIYHSSAVSSVGVGMPLINMSANRSISHVASIYEDPTTITNTGTLLHREWIASGNFSGGSNVSREEVHLKQNASHLIIIESEGNNNSIGHIIRFYENTNI